MLLLFSYFSIEPTTRKFPSGKDAISLNVKLLYPGGAGIAYSKLQYRMALVYSESHLQKEKGYSEYLRQE